MAAVSAAVWSTRTSDAAKTPISGPAALDQARQAGIDVGSVVETVGHRVEPASPNGVLVSDDPLYRAEFRNRGFSLTLRQKRRGPSETIPFERSPAFEIRTARVARGQTPLALVPGSWRGDRNSALRKLGQTLSERVTMRDGTVEWDFVLDQAPAGSGALTIEAQVFAPRAATRRGGRWRFLVGQGRNVTVGNLVVRDGLDRELYKALPAVAGTRLSMTIPAHVLNSAAYPLTIDPVVRPEYPVTDPVVGAARDEQHDPALAFNGTNYLVAWRDNRGGIYGTRVSPTGSVLDSSGIVISAQPGDMPAVTSDGTNYLVVWEHGPDVHGARLSPAGVVLDPTPIPISTTTSYESGPAVAFDGTNYLVVWLRGDASGSEIRGTRISKAGAVLEPGGIAISTGYAQSPSLAFDGTNYLVAWAAGGNGIYGARVSPAGLVLDAGVISISTLDNYGGPAIAFDGTNYLIAWSRSNGLYGARVSPAGTVLDPSGIQISASGEEAAIAFDGTNYLVVWTKHYDEVYGARVSPAGTVLDPDGIRISSDAWGDEEIPALASDGTNYLVVWARHTGYVGDYGPRTDIYGARVSSAGGVLDGSGIVVSTDVNNQDRPVVGFDGTNYLVLWRDSRAGWEELYGARVDPAGTVLDPAGIRITVLPEAFIDVAAVAFDGTNYLAVWSRRTNAYNEQIRAARIAPDGSVLDPNGFEIADARSAFNPTLAFDGTNYLIVWGYSEGDCCEVYGARVTPSGGVLDPYGIPIASPGTNYRLSPAIAFDGSNYLVTWADPGGDVYGGRVSPGGTVLDPGGFGITTEGTFDERAAVAFDGTNYLVAWTDVRGADDNVYGARVSPAGSLLDPAGIAISTADGGQSEPALTFDGTTYLVAWQDNRAGSSDIYGARVTPGGGVLDPAGIAISSAVGDDLRPAITRGAAGRVAVAYERSILQPPYEGATRSFARFVDQGEPPPPPPPPPPPLPPPPPPPAPPPPPPPALPVPPPSPPARQPTPPRARPCVVPMVIGLRVRAARTKIRAANCSVGHIRRARSRRVGYVIAQRPRPGVRRARGAGLKLVVGQR